MFGKLFKLKFMKSKGKRLTSILEESCTAPQQGEGRSNCRQSCHPSKLPPPRIPPRGVTALAVKKKAKKPQFLDKSSVYENLIVNRETFMNVCPMHHQQLNQLFCNTCNA